jgi:hypothetical protein
MQKVQVLHKRENKPLQQRYASNPQASPTLVYPFEPSIVPVRATQGKGLMPDGTVRFHSKGKDIFHFVSRVVAFATGI